jgi:hypothetical protein
MHPIGDRRQEWFRVPSSFASLIEASRRPRRVSGSIPEEWTAKFEGITGPSTDRERRASAFVAPRRNYL